MNVTRQCSTTPIDTPLISNRHQYSNEDTVSSSTFVSLRNMGETSRSSMTKKPPVLVSKGMLVGTAAVDSTTTNKNTNTGSSQKLQQLKASLRDQRRRYQKSSPPPPKCITTTRTRCTGSSTVSVDGTTSGQSSSSSGASSSTTKSRPTGGDAATVTTAESTVMIDQHHESASHCSPSSSSFTFMTKPHLVSRRHDATLVGLSPLSCHTTTTTTTTVTPTSHVIPSPQRHWHSSIHVPNLESAPSSFDQDDDDDDDPSTSSSSVATPPTLDEIYAAMQDEGRSTISSPATMATFAVDSPSPVARETTDSHARVASERPPSSTNTGPSQSNAVTPQQPSEPLVEWTTPMDPITTTATRMEDTLSSELSMETSSSSPTLSLSEFLRLDIDDDDDDDNLCDYTTHSDTSGWASLGDSTAGPLGGGSDSHHHTDHVTRAVGPSPIRATTTPKYPRDTTGTTTTPSWMVDRTMTATPVPPNHVKPKNTVTFQIETIEVKTAKSPVPPRPDRPLPRTSVQQLRNAPVGGSSRRAVHPPKPLFVTARRADELCRAQGGHFSMALRCGMTLLPQQLHATVEDRIPLVPLNTIQKPKSPPTLNVRLSTDFRCGTYGSLYDIAMRSVGEGNSIVAKARPDDASIGSYRNKTTERRSRSTRVVVRTTTTSTTTRNMDHPPRPLRTTPTNSNTTTRPISNTPTRTLVSSKKLPLRPPPTPSALPRRNRTVPPKE